MIDYGTQCISIPGSMSQQIEGHDLLLFPSQTNRASCTTFIHASKATTMAQIQATSRLNGNPTCTAATQHGLPNNRCWVALETVNKRQFLDQLTLPTNAVQTMTTLKDWHEARTNMFERLAQYVLCKQQYVGIGCLEVNIRISVWAPARYADLSRQHPSNWKPTRVSITRHNLHPSPEMSS